MYLDVPPASWADYNADKASGRSMAARKAMRYVAAGGRVHATIAMTARPIASTASEERPASLSHVRFAAAASTISSGSGFPSVTSLSRPSAILSRFSAPVRIGPPQVYAKVTSPPMVH